MSSQVIERRRSIKMGEMEVAVNEGVLRTLLGSCVGVALYDRRQRVGGLVHIVLPTSRRRDDDPPGKFVDTAIPALVERMQTLAARRLALTARIAGGASMFATGAERPVGQQNVEATEQLLDELRIPIEGRHCGGEQGRRMSLDLITGVTRIEIVGADSIEL